MSICSTKNGSTPIFYYSNFEVGASSLNVVNQSLDTIYELPKVAPTEDGQVIALTQMVHRHSLKWGWGWY